MTGPTPERQASGGFTLVELMVVIAILGLLASIVVLNVMGQLGQAEHEKARQDITRIADAIRLYRANTRKYPSTLQDLIVRPSDAPGWNGPYLESESIPKDPWGNEYVYRPQGSRSGIFEIISYGADGVQGGDADNADISNLETQQGNQ